MRASSRSEPVRDGGRRACRGSRLGGGRTCPRRDPAAALLFVDAIERHPGPVTVRDHAEEGPQAGARASVVARALVAERTLVEGVPACLGARCTAGHGVEAGARWADATLPGRGVPGG